MGDIGSILGGGETPASLGESPSIDISSESNPSNPPDQKDNFASDAASSTLAASTGATLNQPGVAPDYETQTKGDVAPVPIRHIGTLTVGDQYASYDQNSPETVEGVSPNIQGRSSLSFSVPQTPQTEASPKERVSETQPTRFTPSQESSGGSFFLFHLGYTQNKEEEERRRSFLAMGLVPPSEVGQNRSTPASSAATDSPSPSTVRTQGTHRYIFDVHDVHSMGGDPSTLSIRDRNSGDVLSRFDLPEGNSQIVADLPPGDYSLDIQSGNRSGDPNSNLPDNLDNFRVEAYSAGPTPASE